MIERYTHNKITWLDIVNPTPEEIHEILSECGIPREFGGDLTTMTPKTEVYSQKGFLKITLDFPFVKRSDISHPHEIKFLVTKTHLVTIRFEDITALYSFGKEFEVLCLLNGKGKTSTSSLFITMLNHLYDSLHGKIDYLESKIKDVEEEIFKQREKEMVYELSQVGRRMIIFRQTISTHERALTKLPIAMSVAFVQNHSTSLEEILQQYKSVESRVNALFSTFENLRSTNDSLLSTKQNETMNTLTALAFITFPLMLFSSMFGMNTMHTPLIGARYDFWIILGVMILVSALLFIYFKYKKWL